MLDVVPLPVVGDSVEVAGGGVELGVGGEPAGQGALEVARPDGLELIGQGVRQRSRFDGGKDPAGVADHVGVGGGVVEVHRAARPRLTEGLGDVLRAHPPVRYHSARPSRSWTPCSIPVPRNQS